MAQAKYIMIGGFLGAGKTTAVSKLAHHLTQQGLRVGLITNDQGRELVDTAMLRSLGFATEEISGGCFCCRFNSLVEAAQNLTDANRPDVIIAEPVGSCTDLVATVTYPLRRIYGDQFAVAPLSVIVDPVRAQRVFGLAEGGNFSEKVIYIYRKQLEEADVIVIGKCDLMETAEMEKLSSTLAAEFPHAKVLSASSRTGFGLGEWFEFLINEEQVARRALVMDYEIYADGEAMLGWLNASVRLDADSELEAPEVLPVLAREMQRRLAAQGAEIAHLKMTLSPDEAIGGAIAVINLVRNDFIAELSVELEEPFCGADVIVNIRAEAESSVLAEVLQESLRELSVQLGAYSLTAKVAHVEHFQPGKPTPTHRDA
jgi:Ni2+-binding GTPase involved in maturation of urease and hydrogenase